MIDAANMEHTKTGDGRAGAIYRRLAATGVGPAEELGRVKRRYPELAGARTLSGGAVLHRGIPRPLAPFAWRACERMKLLVRLRRPVLLQCRQGRARIENRAHGVH